MVRRQTSLLDQERKKTLKQHFTLLNSGGASDADFAEIVSQTMSGLQSEYPGVAAVADGEEFIVANSGCIKNWARGTFQSGGH